MTKNCIYAKKIEITLVMNKEFATVGFSHFAVIRVLQERCIYVHRGAKG